MLEGLGLLIRNVEVEGRRGLNVLVRGGYIAAVGASLTHDVPDIDGAGCALIPALIDHHIHLLALGAQASSVVLQTDLAGEARTFERLLQGAARGKTATGWIRATGYHDGIAGPLTREILDSIVPDRPVRVQYRTGSLWILNSMALDHVLAGEAIPPCVQRDSMDRPTGAIWRGDSWLRERIPKQRPDLAAVGSMLARWGIAAVTDASASTGAEEAALIAAAVRGGELPQRVTLMSAGFLESPEDGAFTVGAVKVLLDEHALPDFGVMIGKMTQARDWRRPIAVHVTTATELAFALAAFETIGALEGDRLEHGSVIPEGAIGTISRLRLTVVTQPAFILERGAQYFTDVPVDDHDSLYRCATLRRAGVRVGGSTDAPYTKSSPWESMACAVSRRSHSGAIFGPTEGLCAAAALGLFLGSAADPGGPQRRIVVGERADLCLLRAPLAMVYSQLASNPVAATIVGGRIVHRTL